MTNIYDFNVTAIDGRTQRLDGYRGNVLLVVNVASKCGFTPQYAGLEELYRKYRDRGFQVLGFPCDQFGHQEPGDETEIQSFCKLKYDVTFPMFAKIDVNGPRRHPLYAFLTGAASAPDGPGDVQWNFAKFLVDRSGNVAARFSPATAPVSEEIVATLEKLVG